MLEKLNEIINEGTDSLDEAINVSNMPDLMKARYHKVSNKSEDSVMFFKMLMTLSNFHSTVSDMYFLRGDAHFSRRHYDYSVRFRNEANKVKNL